MAYFHPIHAHSARRSLGLLAIGLAGLIALWWIPTPPGVAGLAHYLPLHMALETLAIVAAVLVFAVAWLTPERSTAVGMRILACCFLGVAVLDFSHMLSYQGMPDFVTQSSPEKAIDFWFAARLLAATGMLLAALLPWRGCRGVTPGLVLLAVGAYVGLAHALFLPRPEWAPRTFIAGEGLTAFKVGVEIALTLAFAASAAVLAWRMRKPCAFDAPALLGAAGWMALSELFFTMYADVTDVYNLAGHLYKIGAHYLLFRALVVDGIRAPYAALERSRTELAENSSRLTDEHRRLESILAGTRAGTWEWNVQTGETRFNERWAETVGYTLEELAPVSILTWQNLAHPDDLQESGARLEAHFRGESERYDYVCRMRHKLGHWIWVHDRGRVMSWTEDGKPLWMAGTHLEVTDLREAQRATERALAELQSIVEGARDVSVIGTETDGTIRLFNPGAERLLGYSAEELVGHHSPALFHDLDEVEARGDQLSTQYGRDIRGFEVFVDAARRGEAETRRWTYVRKDGERRTVSLSVSAIRDGSNEITGFVGIAIDLTEMIRKQQALEETEHRFRGAFEASSLGLALVAPDGRFLQVNTALCKMLGYDEGALLAGDFQELTHPDDLATDLDLVRQTLAGKIPGYQLRKRYITREGATLWAMLAVSLLRDPQGRPRYFVSQILDITHRVRAEEALRASEAKLSELFRLSPVGIAINRMSDGQFVEANPEFFRLTGHTEERLKRIAYWDLTPFEYEPQEKLQLTKLEQEGRYGPYEKEYIRADGRRVPVLLNGVRFQPAGTSEPLILSVVQDISERKRIERMKSEFVSTVSHELRTPLTSISGALDLAVGGALGELPELAMEMLELAHRNARRLGALVGDLLDLEKLLAGKLSLSKSKQELQALMVDVIGSLAPYADRFGVRLRLGDLPRITLHTDPERFTQILNNLLSNAIKFSAQHAEVEVQAAVHGHMVELQILDRGCGVPESFRKHLFQSFAQADNSNERKSEGTGLGLSISRELAARLGGEIGYSPREGGGSCFWVRLPISEEAPIAPMNLGSPRVLIVEDDPDVAVVLGMLISREGFEPVYASDLAGARAQLGMYAVQAVTLDLGLGQERGEDLLRELRADPATVDLPVLIVSGRPTVLDSPRDKTGQIAKPLNPSALIAALKAIIADTSKPDAPRVLLVEDDPDHAQFVSEAIGSDAALMCARTLSEASGMLSAMRFDLVILDLGLPDGDGRTLLERMPQPSPPVLILSQRELAPDATRPFAAALLKSSTDAPKLQRFIDMVLRSSARTTSSPSKDIGQ